MDIQILRDFPRGRFKHALFDFDGTISLLREGWQGIMAPVMTEMICGGADPSEEIQREVAEFIEESTGIQTLIQMQGLVEIVRRRGLVPEAEVLDEHGYKAAYNDRLMVPVRERLAAIASGAIPRERFMVLGSASFIAGLKERGLTLYIFSGTDRNDVRNEAEALGVAHYFAEIWGALPSLEEYSKEKVLREIITAHGLQGSEVLIIGDGPVELRNAKEHGCVALGVASDEQAGHGWDPAKRERLIKAGADLLVPDFGEAEALGEFLFASPDGPWQRS
ncbi:MAG: HAD family hydrolase [Candidatus Hydrogenedentota bacterium]